MNEVASRFSSYFVIMRLVMCYAISVQSACGTCGAWEELQEIVMF